MSIEPQTFDLQAQVENKVSEIMGLPVRAFWGENPTQSRGTLMDVRITHDGQNFFISGNVRVVSISTHGWGYLLGRTQNQQGEWGAFETIIPSIGNWLEHAISFGRLAIPKNAPPIKAIVGNA